MAPILAATLSVAGCDCGERALLSRADDLAAQWDEAAAEIELAELPEGYRVHEPSPETPRVGVSLGRVFFDESGNVRHWARMRAEGDALDDGTPVPELPTAPEALETLSELDEGRVRSEDGPTEMAARLAPIAERLRKGSEHRYPMLVDLYADRRIPFETIAAVARALAEHELLPELIVRGPHGPQRLPFEGASTGPPSCRRSTPLPGFAPTAPPEPRTSPLVPPPDHDPTAHPCEYQRAFGVAIRPEGHVVTDSEGTITPDFQNVQVGDPTVVTVPPRAGELDFATLRHGLRRLRTLYPADEDVLLESPTGGVTVDEYVRTWRALRGPPDDPIFDRVYR